MDGGGRRAAPHLNSLVMRKKASRRPSFTVAGAPNPLQIEKSGRVALPMGLLGQHRSVVVVCASNPMASYDVAVGFTGFW